MYSLDARSHQTETCLSNTGRPLDDLTRVLQRRRGTENAGRHVNTMSMAAMRRRNTRRCARHGDVREARRRAVDREIPSGRPVKHCPRGGASQPMVKIGTKDLIKPKPVRGEGHNPNQARHRMSGSSRRPILERQRSQSKQGNVNIIVGGPHYPHVTHGS